MIEVNNLKKYIDDFFNDLTLYDDYHNKHNYKDLLKASIDVFLEHENSYTAYEIYETFFMIYQITGEDKSEELKTQSTLISQSNSLLKLAKIMRDYEANTGDLIEKQRDHFIHSVNVFLLGLAIYSQNTNYRNFFSIYIKKSKYNKFYKTDEGELSNEEFLYRWGIAALFHDIGYPVEIIGKQLTKFIDDGVMSISNSYDIKTEINFKNFKEFNSIIRTDPNFTNVIRTDYPKTNFINLYKPTDIMAYKIHTDLGVDLYDLCEDLDNFVYEMGNKGFIDHGYFSAILVLNSYGSTMQKYYYNENVTKDQLKNIINKYEYFFYPIVDSGTAILLHNYYRNAMQKKFKQKQLKPSKNPIAYLLILCDELQEWNRRPIGVKDKQKGHVQEIKLNISEDDLNIKYIIKHGSIGLGFSEEKENLINKLLDVGAIFENFDVKTDVKLDLRNPMEKIVPSETETPDVLLRNIENIAKVIHEEYNKMQASKGKKTTPYDEILPIYKKSNVRQAKSYPYKLNLIGCEIAYKSQIENNNQELKIHEFTGNEIEDLAIIEHKEWCNEKINTGWISHHEAFNLDLINEEQYLQFKEENNEEKSKSEVTPMSKGVVLIVHEENDEEFYNQLDDSWTEKSNGSKIKLISEEEYEDNIESDSVTKSDTIFIHANLVDWDELTEDTKEKDRVPIRKMPEILEQLDLVIVETKLRLLTKEMHETYRQEYNNLNISDFESLPEETKYSNYKQTSFLVKILDEEKYLIVSEDDEREAITEFTSKETSNFGKREHTAWYKNKVRQGWTYAEERNDEQKLASNIVPWEDLDEDKREANIYTFEKLPESCAKIGLKIIKRK